MTHMLVPLAILIVAAYGQTANDCNGLSCAGAFWGTGMLVCIDSDCMFGQHCCSGKCQAVGYSPATQLLGQSCSVSPTACGQTCAQGQCVAGTCKLAQIGPDCSTTCSADSDCLWGACVGGLCTAENLLPGAPCFSQALCATGFACTSGTCQTVPLNGGCSVFATPVVDNSQTPPYNWWSACAKGLYCTSAGSTCLNQISAGGSCQADGQPSCAAGTYCVEANGATSATLTCVAAGTQTTGNACAVNGFSKDAVCASGYCNATGWCVATHTVAVGSPCSRVKQQDECVSGAYCSANSHAGALGTYSCVSGSANSVAAGSTCYNTDQCVLGSNCTYPGDGSGTGNVMGTCTSWIGASCSPAGAGTVCPLSAGLTCQCQGGAYKCELPPAAPVMCMSQVAAIDKLIMSNGYGNPKGYQGQMAQVVAAGPDSARALIYEGICCFACAVGLPADVNAAVSYQQWMTLSFDCATNGYTALSAADTATRCTKDGVTAIPIEDELVSCSSTQASTAATPSPGTSYAERVGLGVGLGVGIPVVVGLILLAICLASRTPAKAPAPVAAPPPAAAAAAPPSSSYTPSSYYDSAYSSDLGSYSYDDSLL